MVKYMLLPVRVQVHTYRLVGLGAAYVCVVVGVVKKTLDMMCLKRLPWNERLRPFFGMNSIGFIPKSTRCATSCGTVSTMKRSSFSISILVLNVMVCSSRLASPAVFPISANLMVGIFMLMSKYAFAMLTYC